MKKIALFILLVNFNLFGEIFNLTDCIKIARSNNNKIEIAKSEIFYAQAQKKQNLSPLLPHFDIDGRYELKNKAEDYSVFTEFGSSFATKTVGVSAQLLVFDFFSAWNNYKANSMQENISKRNLKKTYMELDKEVTLAYFKILENQVSLEIFEDTISSLQQQLKSIEDSLIQGISSKKDILIVKLHIAEQKKNLLKINSEILQSKIYLNNLLGRDVLSSLEVVNSFNSFPEYSLENLQKAALLNNNDIKILKERISALNYAYKSASKRNAPSFYLFGNYTYLQDTPPPSVKKDSNWMSGGIGMKFPLYDGGNHSAEAKKVKSSLDKAKIELKELKKSTLVDVTTNYLKCNEIKQNFSIDDEVIQMRQESLEMLREKYSQGLVGIDAILSAQRDLTLVKLNKNRNSFNFHTNYAVLITLIGKRLL